MVDRVGFGMEDSVTVNRARMSVTGDKELIIELAELFLTFLHSAL